MPAAIRIENVSKQYQLGAINRQMLYQELQSRWARWRGKADPHAPIHTQRVEGDGSFWALRNVSLEIQQGDIVGIIGRNGAGKSTLLKILSRITSPTEGCVRIRGRVSSLLEVGTGFHGELTGRENVYLNGAILGMRRREIERKFDEIVAFAGIDEFLDTPVKRYSSGMTVRLAFAVAAHLEPDILIIDEVLAVGDVTFQQKCLGRIGEVANAGRTVLFVSHQAAAVESLCKRGIVLDEGQLVFEGSQTAALAAYIRTFNPALQALRERKDREGTGAVRVVGIDLRDDAGAVLPVACAGQDVNLHLHFETGASGQFPNCCAYILVTNQLGAPVFAHSNRYTAEALGPLPSRGAFVVRLPRLPLPEGVYRVEYLIRSEFRAGILFDRMGAAFELRVIGGDFFGKGELPPSRQGICLLDGAWRLDCGTAPAPGRFAPPDRSP